MLTSVSRCGRYIIAWGIRHGKVRISTQPSSSFVDTIRWRGFSSASDKKEEAFGHIKNQEWEKRLTPEQFYITREKGTEAPFSGKYLNHYEKGVYTCVCCGTSLFSHESKFDSGSGWPSFHSALGAKDQDTSDSNILERPDNSMGMVRTEVLCKTCDAHLGHVFNDGPEPTGLRYCINSVAVNFVPNSRK